MMDTRHLLHREEDSEFTVQELFQLGQLSHRAAVSKVQGRVPAGSRLVTVTKAQGKVLGGGWPVVTI